MKKCITFNSVLAWLTKTVNHHGTQATLICSQAVICLPRMQILCEWVNVMSLSGLLPQEDCRTVWILRTTWCSQRAAYCKEQYREFALINQRQSSNLGFRTLSAEN